MTARITWYALGVWTFALVAASYALQFVYTPEVMQRISQSNGFVAVANQSDEVFDASLVSASLVDQSSSSAINNANTNDNSQFSQMSGAELLEAGNAVRDQAQTSLLNLNVLVREAEQRGDRDRAAQLRWFRREIDLLNGYPMRTSLSRLANAVRAGDLNEARQHLATLAIIQRQIVQLEEQARNGSGGAPAPGRAIIGPQDLGPGTGRLEDDDEQWPPPDEEEPRGGTPY